MSWALNPTRRNDLCLELYEVLDGSGNYTGEWLETSGISAVRVAASFTGGSPTTRIEEGQFDTSASGGEPRAIRSQVAPFAGNKAYAQVDLTCRYFRLTVTGGSADESFAATVRVV
jgi:hypothetical protein